MYIIAVTVSLINLFQHGSGGQGTEAASSDDGGGRNKTAGAASARAKDQSNYSLVEAAQYGLLQR